MLDLRTRGQSIPHMWWQCCLQNPPVRCQHDNSESVEMSRGFCDAGDIVRARLIAGRNDDSGGAARLTAWLALRMMTTGSLSMSI